MNLKMPKKPIYYMMLSGWLPIPYSQWNHMQFHTAGSEDYLTTDQFYVVAKIIADSINDKISKKKIKKDIEKYLKGSNLMLFRPVAFDHCFESIYTMVQESYVIQQYIEGN